MKLRNKKTGQVLEVKSILLFDSDDLYSEEENVTYGKYKSLVELNADWEDCKPKEPLIKDEKIRKAVKAWAEANIIRSCICKDEMHCITFETERGMFISFEYAIPIPPEGNFTIAELCGEE